MFGGLKVSDRYMTLVISVDAYVSMEARAKELGYSVSKYARTILEEMHKDCPFTTEMRLSRERMLYANKKRNERHKSKRNEMLKRYRAKKKAEKEAKRNELRAQCNNRGL